MATLEELAGMPQRAPREGVREWVPLDRVRMPSPFPDPPGTPLQLAVETLVQAEAQTQRLVEELGRRLRSGGVLQDVTLEEPEAPEPLVPSSPLLAMLATRTLAHGWVSKVLRELLAQLVV